MVPTPSVHFSRSFTHKMFYDISDTTIKRKMGIGKRWSSIECELAGKAYVIATHDEICGAQQKSADFGRKVHESFKSLSPTGCAGTGTYWDRDPDCKKASVWGYVRDVLLKEAGKFNEKYLRVLSMNLTGVTEQEKVNIAVAWFTGKYKENSGNSIYSFKDFNPNDWRVYRFWMVVKDTTKCQAPTIIQDSAEPEEPSGSENHPAESDNGTVAKATKDKNFPLLVTTKQGASKSLYVGRDRAKKEVIAEDATRKRTATLAEISTTEKLKCSHMGVLAEQARVQNMFSMMHSRKLSRTMRKAVRDDLEKLYMESRERYQNDAASQKTESLSSASTNASVSVPVTIVVPAETVVPEELNDLMESSNTIVADVGETS
jgi:hypothetical protein